MRGDLLSLVPEYKIDMKLMSARLIMMDSPLK